MSPQTGIQTAHGLVGFIAICALVVLFAHVVGFRAIVTVGRSV